MNELDFRVPRRIEKKKIKERFYNGLHFQFLFSFGYNMIGLYKGLCEAGDDVVVFLYEIQSLLGNILPQLSLFQLYSGQLGHSWSQLFHFQQISFFQGPFQLLKVFYDKKIINYIFQYFIDILFIFLPRDS